MLPRSVGARLAALAALVLLPVALGAWLYPVPWGDPGTAEYEGYEAKNRLVGALFLALALPLVFLAWRARSAPRRTCVGARLLAIGASLAALGSILEFWAFSHTTYGDALSPRALAWNAFLLGIVLLAIGGVTTLVARAGPWSARRDA